MEYKGKLYAKLGNKYIALEETADDFDNLKSINTEMLEMLQRIMVNYDKGTQTYLDCQALIQKATTL